VSRVPLALAAIALAVVGGCGDGQAAADRRTLTVLAASSLSDAFTELGAMFDDAHDGVDVRFSFAASSALLQQLEQGAPADVIATADEESMRRAIAASSAANPTVIARNRLSIIVEPGNPQRVTGLADLARPDIVFVLCAPDVPCGKLAAAALTRAGVTAAPKSLEENVKGVVSRVTLGEADAGIVYVTDVRAAGNDAEGVAIDIAAETDLEAVYSVAVTARAQRADLARSWIDFLVGPAQRTLRAYGFLAP
jgi:molybdate transport system substrate-binding protein